MFGTRTPRGDFIHAAVLLAGSVLTCLYWAAFFLSDLTKPDFVANPSAADQELAAVYMGFETAFPLPDAFVATCLALAAFYLSQRNAKAVLFGLVGGGAMLFLALIDIWFNVLHGFYAPVRLGADLGLQIEVLINISCILGGGLSILRLWGHSLRYMD